MGEETTPDAKADEQPQAGTTTDDPAQAATTTEQSQADGAEESKSEDPELKRARAEAAKYRTELRKFQKAEEERKQAEMTEAEKLAARQKALEEREAAFSQSQRDFTAKSQVIEEARKAGFKVSPERVFALVKSDIEFNDDGSPTNVRDVVTALAQAEPGLIGAANGSPTNPDRQRGKGLTAADIAGMSDAELDKAGLSTRDMFEIAAGK